MTGTPVISVHYDTYSTVEKIEAVLGKIRIREQKKVTKTKEIMDKEFDFTRLLKELNRITSYNVCYTKLLRKFGGGRDA